MGYTIAKKADKKVQINTAGKPALKKKLEKRAAKNGRTLSQETLMMVLKGLDSVGDPFKG